MNGNKKLDIAFTGVSRSISPRDYYKQIRNLLPGHNSSIGTFPLSNSQGFIESFWIRFVFHPLLPHTIPGSAGHKVPLYISQHAAYPKEHGHQAATNCRQHNCSETDVTQVAQRSGISATYPCCISHLQRCIVQISRSQLGLANWRVVATKKNPDKPKISVRELHTVLFVWSFTKLGVSECSFDLKPNCFGSGLYPNLIRISSVKS